MADKQSKGHLQFQNNVSAHEMSNFCTFFNDALLTMKRHK